MPTPSDAQMGFEESQDSGLSAPVLRSLLAIPGAREWLREPVVVERLKAPLAEGESAASRALFAVTGVTDFESLASALPAPLEARRDEILAGQAEVASLDSPDDVRILARELIVADKEKGAVGVRSLIALHALDWRAPLACAWPCLESREDLLRAGVHSSDPSLLAAILSALRASVPEEEVSPVLLEASDGDTAALLEGLVHLGEIELAAAIAKLPSANEEKAKPGIATPLRQALYRGWEDQRAGMARLADVIGQSAESENDFVSALEARRQALQLDPTEGRLAALARTHLKSGQPAEALALLPASSDSPAVEIATGMAFVAGGALEKGRPLLVHGVTEGLSSMDIDDAPGVAKSLALCGEIGLALDVLAFHLERRPTDWDARAYRADLLVESGSPGEALEELALLRSVSEGTGVATRLEAQAWLDSDQPAKALPLLRGDLASKDASHWRKTVECAIAAGAFEEAERLIEAAPSEISAPDLAVLRAQELSARGKGSEAEATLKDATLAHGSSPLPWLALAALQGRKGETTEAGETLRRAAQVTSDSAKVHLALAHWLRDAGQPSEALEAAEVARTLAPDDPEAVHERAEALLALGQDAAALEALRQAHRAMPARQDVRLSLAKALEATGDRPSAARLFSHLPENAPAEAWFTSARLDLAQADAAHLPEASRAVSRLLRARALGHSDPAFDFWLGRGFLFSGDPTRAAEAFGAFLSTHPRNDTLVRQASLGKAAALLEIGQAQDSLHDLEVLRAKSPLDREVKLALARAYAAASLTDEAVQVGREILRDEPSQAEILDILTTAAMRTGSWSEASKALHLAAHHVQKDCGLWIRSAEAGIRSGDAAQARADVETALAHTPSAQERRRAAFALVDLNEASRALELLLETAEAEPGDSTLWVEVADVAERAGQRAKTLRALERAAELAPGDVEIHARRASLFESLGRHSEAIGAWQKALSLHPEDPQLHGALASSLMHNGEIEAGLNAFAQALSAHPEDAGLLSAAGRAALRSGSVREALDLLQRADQVEPARPEVVTAMAEAWLRLRRPEEALAALDQAGDAVVSSGPGWSLRAEACLSIGDSAAAEESLAEARQRVGPSAPDRIALARAEFRFGHWQQAVDALAIFMTGNEPDAEHALAEAIIGSLEARWLLADAAQAYRHAPPQDFPGNTLLSWLVSFLDRTAEIQPGSTFLHLRNQLLQGSAEGDSALEALQRAFLQEIAPDEAREAVAIAALRRQRPLDALQALKAIEPDNLGRSWQAILAGLAHLQGSNTRMAMSAFEDAAMDAGIRPVALALYAQASLAGDDSQGAVAALNQALAQWPDEPAWQSALAKLYLEHSAPDSALPHLQKAAELEPENGAAQLAMARGLHQVGHSADALEAYDRALPFHSEDADIWDEAGKVALACAAADPATAYFERAIEIAPDRPASWLGAARAAALAGDFRLAQKRAEKALQHGGEQPETLQCLAQIAGQQGDTQHALDLLDRAMAVAGADRDLRLARAQVLIDLGRAADAADELQLHLSEHEDDEQAWHSLSQAQAAAGDLTQASQAAEMAVRLAPRAVAFRVQLAGLAREAGHLDRALDELTQAQGIDPLEPRIALEIGRVFEARRQLDHALEAYQRAADLDPQSAEAFRRAAAVFKSLKAYPDAGRMLERAVAIEPGDAHTLQQLAAVRALELVHGGSYSMAVNP